MLIKKRLVQLSAFSLVVSPIMLAISCSTNQKYSQNDIGGLNDEFNRGYSENFNLSRYAKDIKDGLVPNANIDLLNQKTILLTTGGVVDDQSFNQSVWEAMSKFSREINNPNNSYFETRAISDATQCEAYDYAIAKGYKIWILTGFQQGSLLKTWLKIGRNKDRFKSNKTKIITVDWFADPEMEKLVPPGSILGLNFETQQASFVASYSAAKLFQEINKQAPTQFNEPYFNSFGGGDFSGVTNFNYGFLEGMRQFNQDNIDNGINYFVRSTSPIQLSTSFAQTIDSKAKVEIEVNGGATKKTPQIVFPVAGTLTATAIDFIKAKKSGQWVIGVDTNQALAFPSDAGMLLTSVEKRIAVATYKALITLYGLGNYELKTGTTQDKMKGFLPNGWELTSDGFLAENDPKTGQKVKKNLDIKRGYADSFVRLSNSTLNKKYSLPDGTLYATKYDEIVDNTWAEFYGSKNNAQDKGRFYTDKSTGANAKGLKPTQATIDAFNGNNGINYVNLNLPDIPKEGLEQSVKNVLALKNVVYGYMTANNEKNYFTPVINEINKQGIKGR